ncbi:hypothetical protein L5F64_02320 [Aliarcobacter butzleri]|uniref:hypothetical protein n=1 Tax=Aliarcobacter butzleri TaxID=28197 RepID=UPI001EDAC4E6|nr:hypothetical protein [Aliarcobacter butzleri]MCG3709907.1 hypothetical protein [Aliarcobacter butzleri]MCG3714399.1 hypothetical protein [Aliarcobacter butzleri]MDN5094334.1 hypothetical protein [Aliarcobacter butzleri]
MATQNDKLDFLDRVLKKLIQVSKDIDSGKINSISLNGKIYKKIKPSSYQVEAAMIEFATSFDIGKQLKYSMLNKEPYKTLLNNAELEISKIGNCTTVDTDLDYIALEYKYGVLAKQYSMLKEKLANYEKERQKYMNNKALEDHKPLIVSTDNSNNSKINNILACLLELASKDFIINISRVNGKSPEIWYENGEINKKLCNYADLENLNIELDEHNRIIQKSILKI